MKRNYILIFALTVLLLLCAGCGEGGTNISLVDFADWQSYAIVRSDTGNTASTQAAVKLAGAIKDATGVKPELTTDWVKRGDPVPTGTKEILVGVTNREETSRELMIHDYVIGFANDRVYLYGGSGEATAEAVDWFIEHCVASSMKRPAEEYAYHGDYSCENLTIDGVPLKDFSVKGKLAEKELTDGIRSGLAELTGYYPPEDSEHQIQMITDDSLDMFTCEVKSAGGNVTLAVSENGLDITDAIQLFADTLQNHTGGDISINERKTIQMENVKMANAAQIAEWRKMTDDRIQSILNAPNLTIPSGAKVYYVSNKGNDANDGTSPEKAWATLDKVNKATIASGSYVCFERGGLWRGQLKAQTGVTYTAYGTGVKPKLYASPINGADASLWKKTDAANIWSLSQGWTQDVGTIVFNDGEAHAIKCVIRTEANGETFNNTTGEPFKDYHDLTTDLHFFHDLKTGILYLYSEKNPGERFKSIEFNVKNHIISVGSTKNVTINNLTLKYGGAHGVSAGTVTGLKVTECEIGWIGGSIQSEGIFGRNYGTRYGNGVEIYGGCDNYEVSGNYFYQIYDAAVTQQYGLSDNDVASGKIVNQKNIRYAGNVMEYCDYSIEYFLSKVPEDNRSMIDNFVIEDNYMWYAGYGLSQQRPDKTEAAHIKSWSSPNRAKNYVIRNNIMVESFNMLIHVGSSLLNEDGTDSMPTLENNQFAGRVGDSFGILAQNDFNRREYRPGIVDYVAGKSNGDMFWFIED